ncbi:hypothetical protein PTQ19_07165 [Microbacterium esteraromaticum]|uniref:DUF7426 family protein n=1 Tax=Microbacterium esteraromaticum TaxID=57043 RepID=UPI002368CB59|nr:hypothetical protein [Microbacterium esteraromaticum]WDH80203.1 hypothetical protein PTQ19_07165 [Microbacterium esteraromaticum]
MGTAPDFAAWAVPDLVIPLGGRTYTVQPPSVGDMGKLLACAVRGEVNLKLVKGPIPDEVQEILDTIGPGEHPALGDTYAQMVADGLHPTTIDRMAYYAIFYWARGKEYADALATLLFTPRDLDADSDESEGEPDPKGS